MTPSAPFSQLVALPDAALWTSRASPDFARLRGRQRHVVVLPLFGFADWGLGRPLDLEEQLGTAVLRAALGAPAAAKLPVLVLPPLRWVLGPYPHCAFGVDFETAHELLNGIAASVRAAGFRQLVLFNTSPWNEELVKSAGLEARIAHELQVFAINLAALGLDLHPVRARSRAGVQCAATSCLGALPLPEKVHPEITLAEFRPGNVQQPGSVPLEFSLDEARRKGDELLQAAGRKLAHLCVEIHERASVTSSRRRAAASGSTNAPGRRATTRRSQPAKRRR